MKCRISLVTEYHCSLERAFRAPMLCDVCKVHTGMGPMPAIVSVSDDETWGKPGGTKKVYAAKSWTQKGGFVSVDTVIERRENEYWKIRVDQFQSWMLSFYQFEGEWRCTELGPNRIQIDYTYTMFSRNPLWYPLNWVFTKLFWKRYMTQVLANVQKLAEGNEPYMYG